MESIKNLQLRLYFRSHIKLIMTRYEREIINKYRSDISSAEKKISKMNQNYINYLLYDYLKGNKYSKAIDLYCKKIFQEKDKTIIGDDNTKIILLFLPHLIQSNRMILSEEQKSLPHFRPNNLKTSNNMLQEQIKQFFHNYSKIKLKGFLFHRKEMQVYLESFLIINTENEIKIFSRDEFNNLDCFKIFLRPELKFKTAEEIQKLKNN
jgi:hypothetical protein